MNTFDPSAAWVFGVGLLIIGAVLIAAGFGVFE
jgi:hypothetical protein